MNLSQLTATARALVAKGKGILAADESSPTIAKRFKTIDVSSTEQNRRTYRQLLFTTGGAEEFVSGVILFDETIRQQSSDGTPFPKLLTGRCYMTSSIGKTASGGRRFHPIGQSRVRDRLTRHFETFPAIVAGFVED